MDEANALGRPADTIEECFRLQIWTRRGIPKCGGLFCILYAGNIPDRCPSPQVLTSTRPVVPVPGLLPRNGGWMLTPVKARSNEVKGRVDMKSKENIQSRDDGQIWS